MHDNGTPDGAVCVAVYRPDPKLLARQLSSIAGQTLTRWVCYVGVDGHDADAVSVATSIVGDDDRFEVVEFEENVGFYRNFERLVIRAQGAAWIALADQDDFWYPPKLELLVSALMESGAGAVSGQARVVDSEGGVVGVTGRKDVSVAGLILDNKVTGSFSVFRGSLTRVAIPFPSPTDAAYHDHWLGLCAKIDEGLVFLNEVVQDYIQHGNNVLGEERGVRLRERVQSLRLRAGGWRHVPDYILRERWGWRVEMARTLMDRRGEDFRHGTLVFFGSGHVSWPLARAFLQALVDREVPVLRWSVLLFGAFRWRRYGSQSNRNPVFNRLPHFPRPPGASSAEWRYPR